MADPEIATSPKIGDAVKYTTCYMCACRCGIRVYLRDGKIRYIQGNRNHPVNKGVLCAKGSAGIMQHYSPARLRKPLKRVGERGEGKFVEIEWEEALATAASWLGEIRKTDPKRLAFFTGRDQSQSLTGWWASQFGTPNYAAHGGFCSVNMAAAGLYTIGGSFWEFGEPDWNRAEYLLLFGVAEDHDSNPIKIGLGKLKGRGAKIVSVNPARTGYSAVADEWLGIRPGTDGLFVFALIHELLKAGKVDAEYLALMTNAAWLVIEAPGTETDGMFARDAAGEPLAIDRRNGAIRSAHSPDLAPRLSGEAMLPDGKRARTVFQLIVERYLDPAYGPDRAAAATGIPADTIRRIAAELAHVAFERTIELDRPWTDWRGRRHEKMIGRPVAMHAMRGISAHSNGFHTCRAIHLLQTLLGTVEVPGGFRFKPPFPRPIPPPQKPAGRADQVAPGKPLAGPPLGFPVSPADLLIDEAGRPLRLDKAYSWEAPLASHGLMHMVIRNAWAGDPYPIDTLFLYMANMAWNSSMNTGETMKMLADKDASGAYRIPRIVYADAYYSEMVSFADLVLPDTTYLERFDCISLLDRPIGEADGPADAIRHPVVAPDRDVRGFQSVLLDLGARLGLPAMTEADGSPKYKDYADYIVNHQRGPGIGPLAGWRGAGGEKHGRGDVNPKQIDAYLAHQSFWHYELPDDQKYYKPVNRAYLEWATHMGFVPAPHPAIMQLYSETLQSFRNAARGLGKIVPPESERTRIETYFDPLPIWYAPIEEQETDREAFPLHALTQRPMPMYHSWGSQNAWLRQILTANRLYVNAATAARHGIADDDWIWVESPHGKVRCQVRLAENVNPDTVWTWNAIGKRAGAWRLDHDAPEVTQGFLLNHLISEVLAPGADGYRRTNSDPVTGQAAWFDVRVRIRKCAPGEEGETLPRFPPQAVPPGFPETPEKLRFGAEFRDHPPAHWKGKP